MPPSLLERVSVDFPGYRVPGDSDMIGAWGPESPTGAWFREKWPDSLPFVTWGDYNGDVFVDIAVLLLSPEQWKLVVFHQSLGPTFTPFEVTGSTITNDDHGQELLTKLFISTLRKGSDLVPTTNPNVRLGAPFDVDAIDLVGLRDEEYIYHWNGTQYEELLGSVYE